MDNQTFDEQLQNIFTHFHTNPEISWEEEKTTIYIEQYLKQLGLQPKRFPDMTGLYVDIGQGEPKVGFRTDMDALWQEVNGRFQANHSCGHDGHMTVALGVATLLQAKQHNHKSAIRLIFQPAEETGEGARKVLETGAIDPLEFLYGMHVRPLNELAEGMHAPAIYHGAARSFLGKITSDDAHAARPEEGKNAIEIATAIVAGMQRIWLQPGKSASIKMTQLQAGGKSTNIIPGSATFSIDARAEDNETMQQLTSEFYQVIDAVKTLYDVDIDIAAEANVVAATSNEEAETFMREAIIATTSKVHCAPAIHTPGGEDFHVYAYERPHLKTTMLGLGCGVTPGLHHPEMTFNCDYLPLASKVIADVLWRTNAAIGGHPLDKHSNINNNRRDGSSL